MKENLYQVGKFCIIISIISTILYYFQYQLLILSWIDFWGPLVSWMIRGVLLLVGLALILIPRFVFTHK